MKAIIPAAGLGTRLRPLTYTRPKPVLKVANKPIILHAIDNLVAAGIQEIGIVVSGVTLKDIEAVTQHIDYAQITFIRQNDTLGLGHAVKTARDFVGNSDFCVYLGDNLFERGVSSYIERFQSSGADAVIALVEVENPTAFGVAVLDDSGRIVKLVEKPKIPPSNLAVAGVYCFKPHIFDILDTLAPSARGEYEITDAIAILIKQGKTVIGEQVVGWWKDTGKPEDLLDTNRLILENITEDIAGTLENSKVLGRVILASTATVKNSTIMGPAIIGEHVHIENAYIGPFTSVGDRSRIIGSEVEYSVLDAEVEIENVGVRLQECLLGLKAKVRGHTGIPRTHSMILSDASVVDLSL